MPITRRQTRLLKEIIPSGDEVNVREHSPSPSVQTQSSQRSIYVKPGQDRDTRYEQSIRSSPRGTPDGATNLGPSSDGSTSSRRSHTAPQSEHSSQFAEELESLASIATWSSKPSSYQSWVPYEIPDIPDDVVIEEWSIIGTGSHGEVRRVRVHQGDDPPVTVCFKLFTGQWAENAYERELDAYTFLKHRGVRRCIPWVWYKQSWPRWKWDGPQPGDYREEERDEIVHGLVMEFLEDCQEVDLRKADIRLAEALGQSLEQIHEAGVIHNDIAERNILLVRESGKTRVVWVDFSCAWSGPGYRGTNSVEWDDFCSLLIDRMDPSILTEEVINSKFPRKPYSERDYKAGAAAADGIHETTTTLLSQFRFPPLYLRLAYGTFACVQISVGLGILIATLGTGDFSGASFEHLPILSLSAVYGFARNEPLSTYTGGNVLKLFSLYCIVLLSASVYNCIAGMSHGGIFGGYGRDNCLMSILYSCWLVCGAMAIRGLQTRWTFPAVTS